jgi:hypothetical protein
MEGKNVHVPDATEEQALAYLTNLAKEAGHHIDIGELQKTAALRVAGEAFNKYRVYLSLISEKDPDQDKHITYRNGHILRHPMADELKRLIKWMENAGLNFKKDEDLRTVWSHSDAVRLGESPDNLADKDIAVIREGRVMLLFEGGLSHPMACPINNFPHVA